MHHRPIPGFDVGTNLAPAARMERRVPRGAVCSEELNAASKREWSALELCSDSCPEREAVRSLEQDSGLASDASVDALVSNDMLRIVTSSPLYKLQSLIARRSC
jgi:hypothetical protein